MKENILKQFDDSSLLYSNFGDKCKGILIELLDDNGIYVHFISSRTKTKASLSKKIDSKKDKYNSLSDITDISGIRIITYLESDVNRVAELVEREFQIDNENSIDKRKLKSDQFGYRSLHYVISLSEQRASISENIKYKSLKIEIQIRSILQHAWAEIEHDLGYKGAIAIPENFKRNFNRLAALLETADIEFDRLKKDLTGYEFDVKEIIKNHPEDVLIDQASIVSFVKTYGVFEQARKIIAQNTGCEFYDKDDYIGELERFVLFKIETIGQLESLISKNQQHFLSFVNELTKNIYELRLTSSLPLFYFQHFLACLDESEEFVEEYFTYGTIQIGGGGRSAREIINIYIRAKIELPLTV
jgi:ppGpp synthetase/RelA/SpoT-type nucleotidyltranferase